MLKVQINKCLKNSFVPFELCLSFTVPLNRIICLSGKSGAGKTSLLRMLAGIDQADSGHIQFGEKEWFNSKLKINNNDRKIGFVFQESALFPHMTILENLRFSRKPQAILTLDEIITMFKLETLLHQKPHQISGGQAQRVSLACAIAQEPVLLLLDEPFSALDIETKEETKSAFLYFQKKLQVTVFIVSHQLEETMEFAQINLNIENGQIRKGEPKLPIYSISNFN
jgi:molybdate transport system ATP-binding protein